MNKFLENVMLNAVKNNPQYLNMLKEVENSGMSAEEYFYKKAKDMGVDPQTIVGQLFQ